MATAEPAPGRGLGVQYFAPTKSSITLPRYESPPLIQRRNTNNLSEATFVEIWTPIIVIAGGLFWTRASTGFNASDIVMTLTVISLIQSPLFLLIRSGSELDLAVAQFQQVQKFLLLEEVQDTREQPLTRLSPGSTGIERRLYRDSLYNIQIKNVSTAPLITGRQILRNISAHFKGQKISMIVGPVGCGKSMLLKALNGEMQTTEGHIHIDAAAIAYCDQRPWLRNKSIRENIVGNNVFSELIYNATIHACHLLIDLANLTKGDQTVIGTNGVMLSKGQLLRIVSEI